MTTNSPLEAIMNARHSVRQYDGQTKIGREEMAAMLQTAFLAPTALNQQPIRALVIEDAALRQRLCAATGNTSQLTTASAVVLFVLDRENQHQAPAFQASQGQQFDTGDETIGALDAGLIAMQFMLVAKDHGFDTNPMTGFDAVGFTSILELNAQRYRPLLLVSIGKAAVAGKPADHQPLATLVDYR
ncbi:nitroreductase family protein [Lactiplantibacillus plantarum]|uniref:nitroreductase family protein n=1 Tax=Lactiplantibacillus plantarum TaxID=1590 RepID=UPI002238680A|nr:nitroreductase family protein [Lactiplantibacillus plantarum]MCW6115819.1 nitroreductase family protein [Lactiplantibacillus plantarum]